MAKRNASSMKNSKKSTSEADFMSAVRKELDRIVTREKVVTVFAVLKSKNVDLYTKAKHIAEVAKEHLESQEDTFIEYDDHGSNHTERVIGHIVDILGDSLEKLSSYEVFSIISSAYLHDCGMVLSDSEKEVLKLAENKNYDGCELDVNVVKYIISASINVIYNNGEKNFEKMKGWLFCPENEKELIKYYENLFVEYHEYRNSKIDYINKISKPVEGVDVNKDIIETSNKELRTDFLRTTHHSRIHDYILNSTIFSEFEFSDRLEGVIAKICKGHGEEKKDIKVLDKNIAFNDENCNLQFLAMLLRLGDIMDFSKERASKIQHSLHHFLSQNSSHHWEIKFNCDIAPSIRSNQACFQADCKTAKDYYNLMGYIDWVDSELAFYNELMPEWSSIDEKYKIELKALVKRQQIKTDGFTPSSARINLDQSKILDLLMGMQLYKRKYACFRELYQNSMDACRLQNSLSKQQGVIEFGLEVDDDDKKYLYCLDNGCGMSKEIIEKYLIKIGRSYYKSTEFFKHHYGNSFVPTSQFGIGILSCFMIGNKLSITTKASSEKQHISCAIELGKDYLSCGEERSYDYFYYFEPEKKDKKRIKATGTLVKIYLDETISKELNDEYFEDMISFLTSSVEYRKMHPSLEEKWKIWENNIYNILNEYILVLPEGIKTIVHLQNGVTKEILKKPLALGTDCQEEFRIKESNIEIVNKNFSRLNIGKITQLDVLDYLKMKVVVAEVEGVQFRMIQRFLLPDYSISDYDHIAGLSLPIHRMSGLCVDGIKVDFGKPNISYIQQMAKIGIVNFVGNNRPLLTVDRNNILDDDFSGYDIIAKQIVLNIINAFIKNTLDYIKENNIQKDSTYHSLAWYNLLRRFFAFPELLIMAILNYEDGNVFTCIYDGVKLIEEKVGDTYICLLSTLKRIKELAEILKQKNGIACEKRTLKVVHKIDDRKFMGITGKYPYLTSFLSEFQNLYLIKKEENKVIVKFKQVISDEELKSLRYINRKNLVYVQSERPL